MPSVISESCLPYHRRVPKPIEVIGSLWTVSCLPTEGNPTQLESPGHVLSCCKLVKLSWSQWCLCQFASAEDLTLKNLLHLLPQFRGWSQRTWISLSFLWPALAYVDLYASPTRGAKIAEPLSYSSTCQTPNLACCRPMVEITACEHNSGLVLWWVHYKYHRQSYFPGAMET